MNAEEQDSPASPEQGDSNEPVATGETPPSRGEPRQPQGGEPRHKPEVFSPRRRLQELLAIPDSQRSDAQWDELIELEIQMAPGNRTSAPDQSMRQNPNPSSVRPPRAPQGVPRAPGVPGGAPAGGKKPFKKFRKGPRQGSSGGGGGAPSGGAPG